MATTLEKRLAEAREELERARRAYYNALNAQSWETRDGQSSRSVTNANVMTLKSLYERAKADVEELEALQSGAFGGRAFRVMPR